MSILRIDDNKRPELRTDNDLGKGDARKAMLRLYECARATFALHLCVIFGCRGARCGQNHSFSISPRDSHPPLLFPASGGLRLPRIGSSPRKAIAWMQLCAEFAYSRQYRGTTPDLVCVCLRCLLSLAPARRQRMGTGRLSIQQVKEEADRYGFEWTWQVDSLSPFIDQSPGLKFDVLR